MFTKNHAASLLNQLICEPWILNDEQAALPFQSFERLIFEIGLV